MKKFGFSVFLLTFITLTLFAGGNKEKKPGGGAQSSNSAPAPASVVAPAPAPVRAPAPAPAPPPANPYYAGTAGKGMSLAILIPTGQGLSQTENYLPTLVQGVLVGDFSKYSAISVLDRQNLEKILKETESGIYKDEDDFIKLGEIVHVGYAMTGNITKTSSGYALQVQIADTANGMTKASYSGSCTATELDDFTGIKKASLDLLTQMGIGLTNTAKGELAAASQSQYVNAQTALSKGIIAQQGGNTVESLAYFYEANSYDPSFDEAAARANSLSASVRTGSMGDNIRNDIAWRNEWKKLLDDAKAYFITHYQFALAELVYDPTIIQGKVDYQRETVHLSFKAHMKPIQDPSLKILADLIQGLEATGRQRVWNLSFSPERWWYKSFPFNQWPKSELYVYFFSRRYRLSADLLNDQGRIIAAFNGLEGILAGSSRNPAGNLVPTVEQQKDRGILLLSRATGDVFAPWNFELKSQRIIYTYHPEMENASAVNIPFIVKVSDITDGMTVRITNVYEYLVEDYSYNDFGILNRYGPDIIPIKTGRLVKNRWVM
jgi:TolB-like protein